MDEVKERVLKRIDTMKDEALELLADLVKADSVNPPGDTRKIMDVIVQKTQTFTQNYDTVAKEEVSIALQWASGHRACGQRRCLGGGTLWSGQKR